VTPSFTCARCGEPIGVYEPISVIGEDGSPSSSSYLELVKADAGPGGRSDLVHSSCLPAAWPRHTIRTGEQIVIREVGPQDKPLLVDAFEHLSDESRYKRFLAPIKQLSGSELKYLTEIDHSDHEALIACALDGEPLGVARYVRDPRCPHQAEVAVAVIDEWQGRGVATALLEDLVAQARRHDVTTFTALCLASNHDVIELLSHLGEDTTTTRVDPATLELRIGLPLSSDDNSQLRGALRAAADGRLRSSGESVVPPPPGPRTPW